MPRKKKTQPMVDPSTGMREFRDREAEHRRQDEQAAFQLAADRSLVDAWQRGWKKLELAIPAYLAGKSSRTMVDEISELDKLVDAVGYAGQLIRLREADAFPELESMDGEFHLAICRVVTSVWVGLRFDAADPDELVKTLDANNHCKSINDVAFVRHFIENGGLPTCPQCGKPRAPADIRRGRCES